MLFPRGTLGVNFSFIHKVIHNFGAMRLCEHPSHIASKDSQPSGHIFQAASTAKNSSEQENSTRPDDYRWSRRRIPVKCNYHS